jgi:hypothetical protein
VGIERPAEFHFAEPDAGPPFGSTTFQHLRLRVENIARFPHRPGQRSIRSSNFKFVNTGAAELRWQLSLHHLTGLRQAEGMLTIESDYPR